jgi:TolB protein
MNLTRHHPSSDAYPSFSPDGQRIAFDSDRDGNNEIYTMALDGTDVRRITLSPGNDLAPMWVRVAKETTK